MRRERAAGAYFLPSTTRQRAISALKWMREEAQSNKYSVLMDFKPGDMQFINNYTTLHSRTEYIDHEDKKLRRHMVRLWLKMNEPRRPVGPVFDEYRGVPKSLSRVPEWAIRA